MKQACLARKVSTVLNEEHSSAQGILRGQYLAALLGAPPLWVAYFPLHAILQPWHLY